MEGAAAAGSGTEGVLVVVTPQRIIVRNCTRCPFMVGGRCTLAEHFDLTRDCIHTPPEKCPLKDRGVVFLHPDGES